MAGLSIPFNYRDILIGDEIIYRALIQQEKFAGEGRYGMTWTSLDEIEKSGAFFRANVLRTDFSIPPEYQHCVPEPPCPWDKTDDKLQPDDFNPILMSNDGVYTHSFEVKARTDSGNIFNPGRTLISYIQDQGRLDPSIQSEFAFYEPRPDNPVAGKAVIVIEKKHRGTLENTFYYLFDMI